MSFVKQRNAFGSFGDDSGSSSPTVGISLSWWLIAIVAGVYLIPQLYRVHRTTGGKKE